MTGFGLRLPFLGIARLRSRWRASEHRGARHRYDVLRLPVALVRFPVPDLAAISIRAGFWLVQGSFTGPASPRLTPDQGPPRPRPVFVLPRPVRLRPRPVCIVRALAELV